MMRVFIAVALWVAVAACSGRSPKKVTTEASAACAGGTPRVDGKCQPANSSVGQDPPSGTSQSPAGTSPSAGFGQGPDDEDRPDESFDTESEDDQTISTPGAGTGFGSGSSGRPPSGGSGWNPGWAGNPQAGGGVTGGWPPTTTGAGRPPTTGTTTWTTTGTTTGSGRPPTTATGSGRPPTTGAGGQSGWNTPGGQGIPPWSSTSQGGSAPPSTSSSSTPPAGSLEGTTATFAADAPTRRDQGAPHVKLIASIRERKLVANVAFSHTEGVEDVRFEYGKDKNEVVGTEDAAGVFTARNVKLPVVVRFTFGGKPCTVGASVGFTEAVFPPRCDQ